MPEVSPPRAQNPADRTMLRQPADNVSRTGASLSFGQLLRRPAMGSNPAIGPTAHPGRLIFPQTSAEAASRTPHAPARRDAEASLDPAAKPAAEGLLDPLFCQLAVNSGLSSFVQPNPSPSAAPAALPLREDLQSLLSGLSRRAAWGGDRRRGCARIELSEGALAGATLVVRTERRTVSVELELPPGMVAQDWQQRIAERLEGRGFAARVRVS